MDFHLNEFSLEGNLDNKSCQEITTILDGPQLPQVRGRERLKLTNWISSIKERSI